MEDGFGWFQAARFNQRDGTSTIRGLCSSWNRGRGPCILAPPGTCFATGKDGRSRQLVHRCAKCGGSHPAITCGIMGPPTEGYDWVRTVEVDPALVGAHFTRSEMKFNGHLRRFKNKYQHSWMLALLVPGSPPAPTPLSVVQEVCAWLYAAGHSAAWDLKWMPGAESADRNERVPLPRWNCGAGPPPRAIQGYNDLPWLGADGRPTTEGRVKNTRGRSSRPARWTHVSTFEAAPGDDHDPVAAPL